MKRVLFVFILLLPALISAQPADTSQLRQIAFEQLKNYKPFQGQDFFENKVVNFYYSQSGNVFLLTSTNIWGHCHGCSVHLSLFIFDKKANLLKSYVDFTETGSWGAAPDTSMITFYSDINRFLFIIESGFTSGGYTESYTSVYVPVQDSLKEAATFQSYFGNQGAIWDDKDLEEWEVKYALIPLKDNYPDIICHKTGTDKGKKIEEQWRYHYYKGKGYVKE